MNKNTYSPFNKVVQDNILVRATHKMNRNELILFKQAISQIDTENPTNTINLDRDDIFKILKTNKNSGTYYSLIKKYAHAVTQATIHIKNNDTEDWMALAITVRWNKNNDNLMIIFHPDLLPFLINLKECFTQYEIGYLSYLKSKYSIRLYELFKMSEYTGFFAISVNEFRECLDIENKHKTQSNLDNYVLIPAIKEINKYTDINISLEKKKGKYNKVKSLHFKITKKND